MAQPTGQYVKSQPSQTTDGSVLRSFGPLFEFIITTLILDRTSYKGLYIEWISSKTFLSKLSALEKKCDLLLKSKATTNEVI